MASQIDDILTMANFLHLLDAVFQRVVSHARRGDDEVLYLYENLDRHLIARAIGNVMKLKGEYFPRFRNEHTSIVQGQPVFFIPDAVCREALHRLLQRVYGPARISLVEVKQRMRMPSRKVEISEQPLVSIRMECSFCSASLDPQDKACQEAMQVYAETHRRAIRYENVLRCGDPACQARFHDWHRAVQEIGENCPICQIGKLNVLRI